MKPKLIIQVKGGMVQSVISNCDLEYQILDLDDVEDNQLSDTYEPDIVYKGKADMSFESILYYAGLSQCHSCGKVDDNDRMNHINNDGCYCNNCNGGKRR